MPRNFLFVLCCAGCFTGTMLGQSIIFDPSIPADVRPMFLAIASDICSIEVGMFDGPPPLDLPIIISLGAPETDLDNWKQPHIFFIKTTVPKEWPDQFAFQFAHEMGHVMMNPHGRNTGIIDALCAALSLELLTRLSLKWRTEPPIERLRNVDLRHYKDRNDDYFLKYEPPQIVAALNNGDWQTVRDYLRSHRSEWKAISAGERYRILQYEASILIVAGPVNWAQFRNIGECKSAGCKKPLQEIECRIDSVCKN